MATEKEIEAIHRKYAPSEAAFEVCYTHSKIVLEIALHCAEKYAGALNMDLVTAGCLLHDVGYYPLLRPDGTLLPGRQNVEHGVIGEELLRLEGMPEEICRVASHHTGVGLSKQQIVKRGLPLPPTDFFAESAEEKCIMYADKFHSKDFDGKGSCFNTYEWYERYAAQFGDDNAEKFNGLAELFGRPNLGLLIEKYGLPVRGL